MLAVSDTRDLQKIFGRSFRKISNNFLINDFIQRSARELEITWKYDVDKSLIIDVKQLQKIFSNSRWHLK
jgi:hypothetical protein